MSFARIFARLLNRIWLIIAALVISLAVLVSLARAFLPFINLIHTDIEQFLSTKLGAQVRFASISAGWKNQGPELSLSDILITTNDQTQTPLTVESVKVAINFWQSLYQFRLVTDEVRLSNSRVEFDLNSSLFSLKGLTSDDQVYSGSDVFIDTLLGQNDVVVNDIRVVFYRDGKAFPELRLNELLIQNFDHIHQLSGELYQEGGGAMHLVLELYGDPRLPGSKSEFYMQSEQVNLVQLPLVDQLFAGRIKQGKLNGEIWADWTYEGWQQSHVDIELTPVEFSIKEQTFSYQSIRATTHWKNIAPQYSEVRLSEFKAIAEDDSVVDLGGIELVIDKRHQPNMQLKYQNVEPGRLNGVWALLMDEPELQQWFLAANPQFNIDRLDLFAEVVDGSWELTKGNMQLSQVRLSRTKSSPETPPMSGEVNISGDEVWFRLISESGELDYRPLFRYPIPLSKLEIDGRLLSFSEGSQLRFDRVYIETEHTETMAQGNVFFHQNAAPELSLQAEILRADVAAKSLYLPVQAMDEGLVEYLDTAVEGGQLKFAQLNMQVRLVESLLSQPDASFEILGQINDLDYQYQPDFPKLDKLDALLFFDQNSMHIEALKGQFEKLMVKRASAMIKNFSGSPPVLELDIRAETDLSSAQKLVEQSRLKSLLGNLLHDIQPQGRFNAQTRINIPLEGDEAVSLKGKVSLAGNQVELPEIKLSIGKVKADVEFDDSKIWAKRLSADVLGGKTVGSITTEEFDGSKRLRIKANGHVNTAEALDWVVPNSHLPVKGDTDVAVDAWFCIRDCTGNTLGVEVQSSLSRAQVELPEPFRKSADETWPLKVTLSQSNNNQQLQFQVNSKLIAGFNYVKQNDTFQLSHGSLLIGESNTAIEWVQDHLALNIQLQQADLLEWLQQTKDLLSSLKEQAAQSGSSVPLKAQFSINTLMVAGVPLQKVFAHFTQRGDEPIKIVFVSEEGEGSVTLHNNDEIEIQLQKFELSEELLQQMSQQESSSQILNFEGWPNLVVRCEECSVFGINLNQLETRLIPRGDQLNIEGFVNRGDLLYAPYLIQWNATDNSTRLQSSFRSTRFGNLLRDWGFKVGINGSDATGQVGLDWSGAPYQFELSKLNGGMSVILGAGSIEEVSDAKARIFSLFSLQSLLRRLTLDFKDIYQKGFFYESMSGSFGLKDGVVVTDQFLIKGNAADVSIGGMVDLDRELFDQHVMVTPKVTSSLPVLAGWAVEPTTGIMVWLLSKIFEPAIDVITNIEYRVVGVWDSPQVIELGKSIREVKLTDEQLEAIRQVHEKQESEESDNNNEEKPKSDTENDGTPTSTP